MKKLVNMPPIYIYLYRQENYLFSKFSEKNLLLKLAINNNFCVVRKFNISFKSMISAKPYMHIYIFYALKVHSKLKKRFEDSLRALFFFLFFTIRDLWICLLLLADGVCSGRTYTHMAIQASVNEVQRVQSSRCAQA